MFEFGRDLRKLFAQARESEDLSWLELISVDLLAVEARHQSTDAGRVSCARPFPAWLRAASLWREHARRTGSALTVEQALKATVDAARHARSIDDTARAAVARAEILLLRHDLCGGQDRLDAAAEAVPSLTTHCRSDTAASIACVHARIQARQARLSGKAEALMDAAALMDGAIHDLKGRPTFETDDIRMERAGLALEAGVARRDPLLLDQAGRELQRLVETASPDYRPLTRARALTLCGAGMAALGALAGDVDAQEQGHALFEAAAEQFTPDHSPLDWATIQVVRATTSGVTTGTAGIRTLRQTEMLTAGSDLILGAVARDLLIEAEVAEAAEMRDTGALAALETAVRRRLTDRTRRSTGLDWAVDQLAMARLATAREVLTGSEAGQSGLAVLEAIDVAREHGALGLATRAEALMRKLAVRA